MNGKQSHKALFSWAKWIAFILGGIILLLVMVRLSLMTRPVQQWLKGQIVSAANEQLTVRLHIGNLAGDLWKEAVASDITLVDEGNTVASIDSLHIRYDLLSYFSPVFEISGLRISHPSVKLKKQGEHWNVSTWMEPAGQDTSAAGEGFPIRIEDLSVHQGQILARIPTPAKDSVIVVNGIDLASSVGFYGENFEVSVSGFSFRVEHTRLDEPLTVQARMKATGHSVSLEKLIVATGNSVLRSTARLNMRDSVARATVQAQPLSWKDVAAYADRMPVRHNLEAVLELKGNLRQFHVGIRAEAEGIRDFMIGADIRWDSTVTLTGAQLAAQELNLATVLGDTTLPAIKDLMFEVHGVLPVDRYREAVLKGTFSTGRIRRDAYEVEGVEGSFGLGKNSLDAEIRTWRRKQRLRTDVQVKGIWAQQPATSIRVQATDIDPAYWLQDPGYQGRVSLQAHVRGNGFYPDSSSLWDYSIHITGSRLPDQKFAQAEFEGRFNPQFISNRSVIKINESEAELSAEVRNIGEIPQFNYTLAIRNFDFSELRLTEAFTTAITGTVEGRGRGSSPENLRLVSTIQIDSSVINGESIEQLSARISVADTVATIDEIVLQSAIAEGSLSGRVHLTRWYDLRNRLSLNMEVKDISPFASPAGVEQLRASGSVSGRLIPAGKEKLEFTGSVDLTDVQYNQMFLASRIRGDLEVMTTENPEYMIDLRMSSPVFASVPLQDLEFRTNGQRTGEKLNGDFQLMFSSSSEEGHITHSGKYRIADDSTTIHTRYFELASSLRKLNLERPFGITVAGGSIKVDTARITSNDGAVLELAASYTDSVTQQGYLKGQNLNLTVIQNLLLSEAWFKGTLSGALQFSRSDSIMAASGDLLLSAVEYKGTRLDTLDINLRIRNNELTGALEAIYEDKELITGKINVPFKLGDPAQFKEAFFKHPVDGYLRLNAVSLARFEGLLQQAGIMNTQGILEFNGALEGTAGNPDFSGDLALRDAVLSGVDVNSVTASLDYNHEASELLLSASINSLHQNAIRIKSQVPFQFNVKSFDVTLPDKQDSIRINVEANTFNLAAFNDFTDEETIREVQGRLDGSVRISGPAGNLHADGKLTLDDGAFRAVQAGIRVDHIHSAIIFEPGLIRVDDFRAESGGGELSARGTLELAKLVPGDVVLEASASNFKAANTAAYNAVIDMDARITGTFFSPEISGKLSFINGFVELQNFGEKSVERVVLDSAEAGNENVALYDSLSLNMNVSFEQRFFVRNERYLEMEIELEGGVDLQKEKEQDLQMFGTLNTVGGYAEPLGKRFELEEGVITFTGVLSNPELHVRTLYEPPQPEEEIQIWYIIEGTVENPQFKYESDPPMELENIISYTLFGQPFYALDSWKQVVASSGSGNTTAADMALEVLMDRVETLASQKLGIDVVKIDNTRVGNESGTSITTGWYLNPRVFFAIQNIITGSTPDTSFLLEYQLKENLELIITQGNDSRQGVDLRWSFDY